MAILYALLAPIPAVMAYTALAMALHHARRRQWAHAAGMGIVGLMLAAVAINLIAKAFDL